MAFKYRARSEEQTAKRADQTGGDFQGFIADEFKTYTVKKGDNWIRILPPTWDEPKHYGLDVFVHYGIGTERAALICTAKQPNPATGELAPCAICEARSRAEAAGDEDLAKELRVTKRVLVWLLDMREPDKGPMLWAMPWSLDRDIVKVSRDKRTGELYVIDHPDDGYDINFDTEGENQLRKYVAVQIARRPSSVDTEHLDFVEGAPIPFTLRWRDYKEVKDLFEGMGMGGGSARAPERTRASDKEPSRDDRRDDRKDERRDDRRGTDTREREAPRGRERLDRDEPPPRDREREREREPEREAPRGRQRLDEETSSREAPRERTRDEERADNTRRNSDIDPEPPFDGGRRVDEPPPRDRERSSDPAPGGAPTAAERAAALKARYADKSRG